MRTLPYEEARLQPLTSDVLIEERVRSLIGRASRHQLWFLFLDDDQVQLPLMIPLDDLPSRPNGGAHDLARAMGQAMDATGARSVVVVIERYAGAALTASDLGWAEAINAAFHHDGLTLRGILLSHNRGVRWIGQAEYLR